MHDFLIIKAILGTNRHSDYKEKGQRAYAPSPLFTLNTNNIKITYNAIHNFYFLLMNKLLNLPFSNLSRSFFEPGTSISVNFFK